MNSDYRANWARAFEAGVIAGAVLIILMWLGRAIGITELNLTMMMGANITQTVGLGTWLLGFVVHLLLSGLLGMIYGFVLEAWGYSNLWRGLILAIPHVIIVGLVLLIVPFINPAVPENPAFISPGFLAIAYGWWTVFALIVSHLAFGMVVGGMYRVLPEHLGYHGFHRVSHA